MPYEIKVFHEEGTFHGMEAMLHGPPEGKLAAVKACRFMKNIIKTVKWLWLKKTDFWINF